MNAFGKTCGPEWADVELRFSPSSAAFLRHDKDGLWRMPNNITLCHFYQLTYSYRWWECWGWPWTPKRCSSNAEGWSVLVVVGDCGGRDVEQEGKKKKPTLNGLACLVNHGSRGVTVCDNKQRHAVFLSLSVCLSISIYGPARSLQRLRRDRLLRGCVLILYLAAHNQLFIIQISWRMTF